MRRDMGKVLTERTRKGGDGRETRFDRITTPRERRTVRGVTEDLRPKRESLRRRWRVYGESRAPSDLIGPLKSYLVSQAGRPWSKVWSEICAVLRGNGLQAQHVKDHVRWEVGGIPHAGETSFSGHGLPGSGVVYVDRHGILRRRPKGRWKGPSR